MDDVTIQQDSNDLPTIFIIMIIVVITVCYEIVVVNHRNTYNNFNY